VWRLLDGVPLLACGREWIDPCVGDGAIVQAVKQRCQVGLDWSGHDIRNTEFVRKTAGFHHADYLTLDREHRPWQSVCIMNPPFSRALQFAAVATSHCTVVAMLQRRNWLTSALRFDRKWIEGHPCSEHLLPERISFVGGTTDNQEYQWYCWPPQTGVKFLASTPLAQRRVSLKAVDSQMDLLR
jgi:hypothetical protein